ncbi:MAG: radical SAM protein [Promethearchaeati archaeon SRVP18_Atabeyarchaeia-1]
MRVLVAGSLDLSSVDYIGRPAAVIFTPRCNYNCPFCQNWRILEAKPEDSKEIEEVFRVIDSASSTIEAVKITGGEPTLYPDLIKEVSNHCRKRGLLFGFDTNGFLHGVTIMLIPYSDLISLDLKAPPDDPNLMEKLVGLPGRGREIANNTMMTLKELLRHDEIYLDIRTTVVPTLNDRERDFERIGEILRSLGYDARASEKTASYTLQEFLPEHARDENMRRIRAPTSGDLTRLARATGLKDVYVKHRDAGFMVHRDELAKSR